jgi:hypothetical protein
MNAKQPMGMLIKIASAIIIALKHQIRTLFSGFLCSSGPLQTYHIIFSLTGTIQMRQVTAVNARDENPPFNDSWQNSPVHSQ